MWEDPHCKDGGKWGFVVPKTHTNKYWEDILMTLIGNSFTDENEVNGVQVTLRPHADTFQVWNKSGVDQERIANLKKDIEKVI